MRGLRALRAAATALALLLCAACFAEAPGADGGEPDYIYDFDVSESNVVTGEADDPEGELEEYVSRMSLEQKVRQMLLVSCHDASSALAAARFGAGGVCLYANYFTGEDRAAVRGKIAALQAAAELPLLVSVDEEGGGVCRVSSNPKLRAAKFSSPRRLYSQGGWPLVESDAREKAQLLLDLGINLNLAPVVDVPLSTSDYIYSRSMGTDVGLAAELAARLVKIAREEGIGATLKHFPGYGGSSDTHRGVAYDGRDAGAFLNRDLLPFIAGIAAGAPSVMVSHNIVRCMDDQYPASLSPEVHRILRQELGFEGVIITDDLAMEAIRQFSGGENAAVQAVRAGNDLICCADYEASAAAIQAAVERGEIPESRIDASVLRILRWKRALGLL